MRSPANGYSNGIYAGKAHAGPRGLGPARRVKITRDIFYACANVQPDDGLCENDPHENDPGEHDLRMTPQTEAAARGGEALRDHPMMLACRREPAPYTPVWLMRQAGRYMPEYRRVRAQHDFLEMCQRPEIAAQVTVTAVERLGVDAAIIFADILLPLIPMEVGLRYEKEGGPTIERTVRSAADLERIPRIDAANALSFVGDAIKMSRRALGDRTPLIGFAGAPFTLASYLIEGGGSRQYQATKTMMYTEPATWHRLMETLARATAGYLNMQIAAGADLVQFFDSWVGILGPDDYRRFVLPHTAAVISALSPRVPVIHFGTMTGSLLELMREAGGDVIGLDWRVDLGQAWARLGDRVGVQGNLDPVALFADIPEIRRRVRAILDQAAGRPGHIFNLGHGILPETPVDHVRALIDAVHEMSRK
jgi:uroporphyrinogen decarboxylase